MRLMVYSLIIRRNKFEKYKTGATVWVTMKIKIFKLDDPQRRPYTARSVPRKMVENQEMGENE